ncbi:thiamine phosphate synthase [Nocardioides jensenii]
MPVYALGGITSENAAAARTVGARGVAVMGEIMRAVDPAATVARLLEVVG